MSDSGYTRRDLVKTGTVGAVGGALAVAGPAEAAKKKKKKVKTRKADVIVVGAGFAGLTAAREIVKGGHSVLVAEAVRRVGGRSFNHSIGNGEIADLGATFAGPTQDHILALAKEMGVSTFPTYNRGDNVFWANGRRLTYSDNTPLGTAPPDPAVAPDTVRVVALLDTMAEEVPVDAPWKAPQAEARDSETLYTFLKDNSSNPEFMALASAALEAIMGAEPRDISLLYTLFYIASSGNEQNVGTFERNFNTRGGAQEQRFAGGTQLIAQRMAKELGKRVLLKTPARRIEQSGKVVKVISDRVTLRGKRVIVAMPPMLAGRINYRPAMPFLRDQLTQRTPQGTMMKIEAIYDRPFWRSKNLTGQSVSENGPVKVTFDASPVDGSPGVLMGFIGGREARIWGRRSAADRRQAALRNLANYFGDEALKPREFIEFNWANEVWNRGCPVAILGPGTLFDFGTALKAPVGRIHWAGSETADYWNGYMDGAVRSGKRAAREVLAEL